MQKRRGVPLILISMILDRILGDLLSQYPCLNLIKILVIF